MQSSVDWPASIHWAIDRLGMDEPEISAYVNAFVQRWGGLAAGALHEALQADPDPFEDRLFALLALGATGSDAADELVPFLQSPVPLERWASAICLGHVHDRRAVPGLCTMLTEFLPTRLEVWLLDPHNRFTFWRNWAPILLDQLGDPAAVPALRHALQHLVSLLGQEALAHDDADLISRMGQGAHTLTVSEHERVWQLLNSRGPQREYQWVGAPDLIRTIPDWVLGDSQRGLPVNTHRIEMRWFAAETQTLITYQDSVIHALGRLGALGALTGVAAAEVYQHVWMVQLLMAQRQREWPQTDSRHTPGPALEAALRQGLMQVFGLNETQQRHALAIYSACKHAWVVSLHTMQYTVG
jgi:hypothetical protein